MSLTPLILIALMLLPAPQILQGSTPTVDVEREAAIISGGLLLVNDTITLMEAPPGLTSLSIGQPLHPEEGKAAFHLYQGGEWIPLEFEVEDEDPYRWFLVHLPKPHMGGLLRLRASHLYVDAVRWERRNYVAEISLNPILTWNITSLSFEARLPEDVQLLGVDSPIPISNSTTDGLLTLNAVTGPLGPREHLNITLYYTPPPEGEEPIGLQTLSRRVRVEAWRLRFEEDYTLINRGPSLEQFLIELPPEARVLKARDRAGPLKVSSKASEEGVDVYVYPRSTVRGEGRWSFTLIYTLPKGDFITHSGSRYTLSLQLSELPYYIYHAQLEVLLPDGAVPVAHQPQGEAERLSPISYRVSFDLNGVSPLDEVVVSVDYRWTPFWLLLRPMLWGLLILAVGNLLLAPRRRRRIEVEVEERPPLLEEFLELYEERVSLLLELEELEEALERREIGRERFERGSAEIHRRLMALSRRLRRLEARLEEEQPELRGELEELREAEGELEGVISALRGLERRLRRRRISRRDYIERRREHIERRRRAVRRIEEIIAAMRSRA